MGFLQFLFGSKEPERLQVLPDRVWLSQQAKWRGLRKELATRCNGASVGVLLIAHFPDTLAQLDAVAAEQASTIPVVPTLAEHLSQDLAGRLQLDESATLDVIVAERHPLPDADDQWLEFARELPFHCRVTHHLALDDPLLQIFAGDWVAGMLKNLGMTEHESIESALVSRRIRAAQKKVKADAMHFEPAGSAAEWLAKNLPERG